MIKPSPVGIRPPLVGLLAFGVIIAWRPMAHAITVLMHEQLPGPVRIGASFVVGLFGFWLMWKGFKRDETTASLMGVMAGSLIWTGWAEEAFNGFGAIMQIEPLMWNGHPLFNAGLQMIEASVVPMMIVLILLGANKDTQCRMFLWFHRNLRITPDKRTAGYQRQISRVTTIEYIFVVWFFYVFNIIIFDPRVLGPDSMVTMMLLGAIFVWGCWLVWQLTRLRNPGAALRYAIPTVGCWWVLIESAAAMGLITEVWVRPREYPLTIMACGFICVLLWATYFRCRTQQV